MARSEIQAVVVRKAEWTTLRFEHWLKAQGFAHEVEERERSLVAVQQPKEKFVRFRIKSISGGLRFVLGIK